MSNFYSSNATLKALTIFSCFAFSFFQKTNAQSPVLTADNSSPHIGDKFVFISSQIDNYDTSHSGINQVWDYSGLKDSLNIFNQVITDTQVAVLPSATPFAANFPQASFATTHSNSPIPYYFYYSNNTGISLIWGNEDVLGNYNIYTKPSGSILYPISYGDSYTDSNSYFNNLGIIVNGADSSYADGYGTLILPSQTIPDVVRIKAISSFSTPAILNGHSYIYNVRLEAYYYFTTHYHANILGLHHFISTYFSNGITVDSLATYKNEIYHIPNTSVLPLKIISFNANLKGQDVLLQWQTANEINTNYFNIQRSSDGIHFNIINKVIAAGNNNNPKNYLYSDVGINELSVSKLYYRLQEVDKDGKSNYSSIKTVDLSNGHSLFSVSPNPSKDFINIASSYNASAVQVKITDLNGKILFTSKQDFVAGQQVKISLARFPSDILIVTVVSNGNHELFKIVKG